MRLKRLQTIWITYFTLAVLTLSGALTSAPLMAMPVAASNQHVDMMTMNHATMTDSNTACADAMGDCIVSGASEMTCGDGSNSHDCCPSMCISVSLYLATNSDSLQQLSNLALISTELAAAKSSYNTSLYRPPIA